MQYVLMQEGSSNQRQLSVFHIPSNRFIADSLYIGNKSDLIKTVDKVFSPNKPLIVEEHGLNWLNTYKKYSPVASTTPPPLPFIEFLERLFPDDKERQFVTSFLAHLIQKPEQRPSFGLLLTSDTGTGKGFLFNEILTPLLRYQTALINSFDKLIGQFSNVLKDNLLLLIDDAKTKSNSTQTKLKSILTEERQLFEPKGKEQSMSKVYTRILLASNQKRPLKLDSNERRWYVPQFMTHKENRTETQAFIQELSDWLEYNLDSVFNYLNTYPIDDFNHKVCPITDTLLQMIDQSKSSLNDLIESMIEEYPTGFKYSELTDRIKREGLNKPDDKYLQTLLNEHGLTSKRVTTKGSECRMMLWARNNHFRDDSDCDF